MYNCIWNPLLGTMRAQPFFKVKHFHFYIFQGMLWKKLIERKVQTDLLWKGLAERRNWSQYLFKPRPGEPHPPHNLQRINCRSENSKGVYCLQYDDAKIVSGLRDNTIKMWDRNSLACTRVLNGHTGSVLCLQYDERVIISGSSDSTVRVWDVLSGDMVNTLIHHCEAVLVRAVAGVKLHLKIN